MHHYQKQTSQPKNNIKKIVSWTVGLPAGLVAVSETNDLSMWYVPFIAIAIVAGILYWNGAFNEERQA